MGEALMQILYGIIVASLLLLAGQQGMIPVVDTNPASTALNACLVSAWKMNEGSGTSFFSYPTAGVNDATVNSSSNITWQSNSGLPGTTPHWNGSGFALASSNTLTNFDGSSAFSISIWASVAGASQQALMTTLKTASNFIGWEMNAKFQSTVYQLDFFLINNYPSNAIDVQSVASFSANTLHYFVVTYDGSKSANATASLSGVKFYIDGSLSSTNTVNTNTLTGSTATSTPVRFMARDNATIVNVNGTYAAFAEVYNCALTSGQITSYNSSGPGIY